MMVGGLFGLGASEYVYSVEFVSSWFPIRRDFMFIMPLYLSHDGIVQYVVYAVYYLP